MSSFKLSTNASVVIIVVMALTCAGFLIWSDSPLASTFIPLLLPFAGGAIVSVLKQRDTDVKVEQISGKVDDNTAVTEDSKRELGEVKQQQADTHVLVDGQAHEWRAAVEKIAALESQIASLMGMAAGRKEGQQIAIDLLATNAAAPPTAVPGADGTVVVEVDALPATIHVTTPEEPKP